MPASFSDHSDVDAAEFRHLCGQFASGVMIITAAGPDGAPAGMTANSFASVSLKPPLVSINVDHQAEMHPILAAAKGFVLNVLASGQEALSRRFAANLAQRFDGIGYHLDDRGFILLDGVLANKPRVLVGSDAKALDWVQRLLGARYQRLFTLAARRLGP